jgi:phosphate:Na+ symporter
MYKIIGEMESLGDSGESISRMLQRARTHGKFFDEDLIARLNRMLDNVDEAYRAMLENLKSPYGTLKDITNAEHAEDHINECRNTLREEHIVNIEENPDYNYQTGVFYIDIVSELEKLGDFIINISQAKVKE